MEVGLWVQSVQVQGKERKSRGKSERQQQETGEARGDGRTKDEREERAGTLLLLGAVWWRQPIRGGGWPLVDFGVSSWVLGYSMWGISRVHSTLYEVVLCECCELAVGRAADSATSCCELRLWCLSVSSYGYATSCYGVALVCVWRSVLFVLHHAAVSDPA